MSETSQTTLPSLASAILGHQLLLSDSTENSITQLIEEAQHHGVIPLLNIHVHEGSVLGISDNNRKQLSDLAKNLAIQDLMLNASTRKTIDLLATNNIPALLLKGTPIAFLYYPDTYLRPRCDTDIRNIASQ